MQPGDAVMTVQYESSILHRGEEPTAGVPHWIYATVIEVLKNDAGQQATALVEINHPGNIQHGVRLLVARRRIRTLEEVQKLHDEHPSRDIPTHQLNLMDNDQHREINNYRAALERLKPVAE